MLISWRPFSSDCGMLLHLTQNSRKELSWNQSGRISDEFMRKSAHKCANLTKTLRLRISCIFYTFDCKFVSCAFFVIVFVLVRQTSLTAKMGFMGISAQNSKMDCRANNFNIVRNFLRNSEYFLQHTKFTIKLKFSKLSLDIWNQKQILDGF